ncbi:T9SS type A sorting domain-containing protein [Winogradskyella sediminis]|uniref:T9SS type A sorting domain-containing protein n=1 Tax=Winogradskyella sediminis TaxID=1382466 RepID=UPI000E24820D|nr:T9SS type A sorting domain-containing protein [Winogradskyella sediminis]REG89954.1 putative secreted protein (Por secretion system target) [Winogradskyella sediminis]
MKHIYVFLIALFIGSFGFGQTTIAQQDFETSPSAPVLNFTNSGGSNSTGSGSHPIGDNNFVSGARGWEVNNGTSTVTFSSLDVSVYTNIELNFRLASFSGSSGNGADNSDEVLVEISLDGGSTFSKELEVEGNSNARWSFDTGTGIASTAYDGDDNQSIFVPSSGNNTTNGYTYVSITDITSSSELVVKITMNNNSSNEYWIIDDLEISGIATSGPANPDTFTATAISTSQIDIAYADNAEENDIIIVFDTDNSFTTPSGAPATVGNTFAGGTVIYDSNGSGTFNHTGLTEGTTYFYKAYSYDGFEYSFGLSTDATTPIACPSITGLTIDSFTDVEAVISWTNGTSEEAWEIIVQPDGTGISQSTSGSPTIHNPHTELGLSQNTQYEVYVRANCTANSNGYSNWVGPVTFTTEITPPPGSTCNDPIDLGTLPYTSLGQTTIGFGDDYFGSPGASGCGSTSSYLNGNDIVYAYTSDEDGTININLSNITDNYTGVFIYDSCADIGSICQAGNVTGSSYADLNIELFPVTNGQTYYIVVSTWASPQTTTYDLSITKGTSNLSDIIEANYDEPDNIDYTLYNTPSILNVSNAIKIGEFTIQDAGDELSDSDAVGTILTDISFTVAGFENIAALALFDGSTNLSEETTVTATTTFTGLTIQANDDLSKTFAVYATFKSSVTDNEQIQLTISNAIADPTGSTFATADAGGALTSISGDDNRIEVTATDLIFNQDVSETIVNTIMSPSPTVLAVDAQANIDLDFTGSITLTSSIAAIFDASATTSVNAIAGEVTFDNLIFDTIGTNYNLTANFGSLNNDTSSSFDVIAVPVGPVSIWSEPFTDNSQYNVTMGAEGYDGNSDYFQITDGSDIGKTYTGGNDNFFAGQDIDDSGWTGSSSPSQLTWTDIDIENYTSLNFSGYFASVGGGIDANDYIHIEYRLDGGTWTDLLAFENDGNTYNTNFYEDTTFNGTGDGTQLSSTFTEFVKSIPTTGLLLDLRITIAINSGSEDIALEDFSLEGELVSTSTTYTYTGTWSPSNPDGTATANDAIVITSGNASISSDTAINSVTVNPGAALTVDASTTLTVTDAVTLESSSTSYSSLILDGAISGTIQYERHVNGNAGLGDTNAIGDNDLVTPPLSGQTFGAFAAANSNLLSNPVDATEKAFAIFDKTTGDYENYNTTANASTQLTAGTGYRAATSNTATLVFTGSAHTGDISMNINHSGPSYQEWNLIGNPYPSYLDAEAFLNYEVDTGVKNIDLLGDTSGIYGYDGNSENGWDIINLANASGRLITPGQGFLVGADAANVASYDLEFTTSMRTIGNSDDFIAGRDANTLTYLKLNASTATEIYTTQFYFNAAATQGLDAGYDATIWGGTAPNFALFSHLIEDNNGLPMALQALDVTDLSNVTIPLGVNANQGEQLTFSINASTLPSTVNVYLEDNVANTSTLLNTTDYILTPNTALNGTGRFYLRVSNSTLSTIDNTLEHLSIYTNKTDKSIVVAGQLLEPTTATIYDVQGRLVLSTLLQSTERSQAIDVSALNTGIYVIKLHNASQNKTQKVIIR